MTASDSRVHIEGLRPGDVALLRDISEAAAEKAVQKTFLLMGLDVKDPINTQRDFSFLRDLVDRLKDGEISEDLKWVRRMRKRSDGAIGKAVAVSIGVVILGALHTLWLGLKSVLGVHP